MRLALDTNAYVAFCKGEKKTVLAVQGASALYLPFICMGELRTGFLGGKKSLENEKYLIRFLNSPRVTVLYPDEQTTHHYARIFVQLKKQGTPIPTNDLWISALVLQHDLPLLTFDRHFEHLPQISRVAI
ncbi:MAG TPA: VapC toxin family PIN domain ribonuclease [Deltaproteobacteria bacterium]|nr:VapC toxin family PIN domain ribonuclease [Deltaproteobacteria bacterium]